MTKGQIILTLTLSLSAVSVAWAQTDQQPAPSPVPAFGQENPVPPVSENPPISAIDQPGLEPHAAPESFFLPGLHVSESADSNVANSLGGSSLSSVTRGLGSLTLQKLWKTYDVAMDYIGGVAYYDRTGVGLEQLQQFDMDNRINWKRGQLAIRDSFSYLPEGTFGFGAFGGSGAYSLGLGSLGAGMLGSSAFGSGSSAVLSQGSLPLGQVPRLTNLGLADIVENLSPKSSVTLAAGYGLTHFYGTLNEDLGGTTTPLNTSFIGSREFTGQLAYDRVLNPKDQVALSYGYQAFDFSTSGTAFHSNVIQAMYGHRISGRMDFLIGAGPQFTHIDANQKVCTFLGGFVPVNSLVDCTAPFLISTFTTKANHTGLAGRISLRYKFPKASVSISLQRFETSGSGIYAGSESTIGSLEASRPLSRLYDVFAALGYSKNVRSQLAGSTVNANAFTSTYAGVGLHRQFTRSLRGFASYQFNYLSFNVPVCPPLSVLTMGQCEVGGSAVSLVTAGRISQRSVGSIGLDWTPRPIRLN
jgi:hypothetical protein